MAWPAPCLAASGGSSSLSLSQIARDPSALAAFIASSAGKSAIVLAFFLGIAFFLRFLYGPKGLFREKRWDELNAEFRADESLRKSQAKARLRLSALSKELEPLLQKEGAAFTAYVSQFYTGDPEYDELHRLKQLHSEKVLQNAWALINAEPELQEPLTARLLLLAALYHDIGRFEQIRDYKTFVDNISVDHAKAGMLRLAESRFLAGEPKEIRRQVRAIINLHSRACLPAPLLAKADSPLALAARALRDADKLDIIRVTRDSLESGASIKEVSLDLADAPDKYNPTVADAVLGGQNVPNALLQYQNDYRLRLCGWVNFFEFPGSLRLLARSGDLEAVLSALPAGPVMDEVRDMVRARLSQDQAL